MEPIGKNVLISLVAFSATSTADDLLKSKCTSCGVAQDKSAYWAPPLYFVGDDGTTTVVPEKPPFKAYVKGCCSIPKANRRTRC